MWQLLQSLNQGQLAAQREGALEEILPAFWVRPATRLHSVHKIAVPSSGHCSTADKIWHWPKYILCSGWRCVASRLIIIIREMWSVDCSHVVWGRLHWHLYIPVVTCIYRMYFQHNNNCSNMKVYKVGSYGSWQYSNAFCTTLYKWKQHLCRCHWESVAEIVYVMPCIHPKWVVILTESVL